ncbi:MAG: MBL fold metallo-hydrolase [Rhodothermales bacterium]
MSKIGPYTLHTIETGRFALDGGAMFGIIPKALWERRMAPDARNRIPLNMRCLLLEGDGRLILVDNGLGEKYDEKFGDIYGVDHDSANLGRSLREAGFSEDDVTDVILTHLHFDHCGGSTKRTDTGRLELTFKNARHYVQRRHWECARSPNLREEASFLRENLDPLAASDQIELLDGEGEVLPGIEVLTMHGHTESQQLVKISDREKTLVYVADLLPTSMHARAVWIMAYDVRPLVSLEEKQRFLERAVGGAWHFFFEHDPTVVVGTPQRTDRGIEIAGARSLDDL